jgi:dienelactone hydrolase
MKHALRSLLLILLLAPAAPTQLTYPRPVEVKESFLKLLDRPKVPLDAKADGTPVVHGSVATEKLSFATERKADGTVERVPTLVFRPAEPAGRLPAVIVLHGTGANKEAMRGWLAELARRGFVALAFDARYHGERAGGPNHGTHAYNEAVIRAWRANSGEDQEHPFYYDTCWDAWRAIDYLQGRPDVDPERIGMLGVSMGGIETWLAASVDDRIKVAVPIISVQCFRWTLEHDRWHARSLTIGPAHKAAAADQGKSRVDREVCRALWNKVVPGILGPYDCPSMIRLFAPRPLLVLACENDPLCPLGGAEMAFDAARSAYRQADSEDKLQIDVAKHVGHMITMRHRTAALGWFERWLKTR